MAAYRGVCDSRHLQADCQEPGSAPEPYALESSMGYLYLYFFMLLTFILIFISIPSLLTLSIQAYNLPFL